MPIPASRRAPSTRTNRSSGKGGTPARKPAKPAVSSGKGGTPARKPKSTGTKLISVCGQVCYFGETLADGTFKAQVGRFIKVANFAASVHGRPDYVSRYEKLPEGRT